MFPTNDLTLPPPTIARLYKCRWQVELFFKWIKQHPRIKRFFGTAENAVKTQSCGFQASRRSRKHRSVKCSARTNARRIDTHSTTS